MLVPLPLHEKGVSLQQLSRRDFCNDAGQTVVHPNALVIDAAFPRARFLRLLDHLLPDVAGIARCLRSVLRSSARLFLLCRDSRSLQTTRVNLVAEEVVIILVRLHFVI